MAENLCDNVLCIYWNNNTCALDSVTHDAIGVCTQGIHIDIDETYLDEKKAQMLKRLHMMNSE